MEQMLFTFFEANYIQFPFQLMISESVFLIDRQRREHFGLRLPGAILLQFLLSWIWLISIDAVFQQQMFGYVLIYSGYALISGISIWLCFDIEPLELIFIMAGGYATEHMTFAVGKILLYATNNPYQLSGQLEQLFWTRYFFYFVGAALVYLLVIRNNPSRNGFSKGDARIGWLSLVLMLAAVGVSVYWTYPLEYSGTVVGELICPFYSALSCGLVLLMEYYVLRENNLKHEQQIMEQVLQLSDMQQKSAKEAIDIINIKCHDLKHQIKALAKMEDPKTRSEYLQEVQEAVSIYDATYHTGCKALDYVLREKTLIFNEYQITFSCMADGSLIDFMTTADVYAFLGNALDNALERVLMEAENERVISLQIKKLGRMVLVHLENRCSQEPEFKDGLPVTHKPDKTRHGFGVKSIRYIVEKYQGQLSMRAEQGKFYLDVLFQSEN